MSSVLMGWDRFAELPTGCKGGGVCERPHTPPPLHPRGPRVWCIIPYTFPTTSRVMHNPLTLLVLLSIRKVLKESPCPLLLLTSVTWRSSPISTTARHSNRLHLPCGPHLPRKRTRGRAGDGLQCSGTRAGHNHPLQALHRGLEWLPDKPGGHPRSRRLLRGGGAGTLHGGFRPPAGGRQ